MEIRTAMDVGFLAVFASILLASEAQSPVYVLNEYSQLVTSSTLQWVTSSHGSRPLYSVSVHPGATNESILSVCRAAQRGGGSFYAGGLGATNGCAVSVGDQTITFERYQVLVNVDEAARLEWTSWRQFDPLPTGAISAEKDIFVARAGDNIAAGGLHLREQYGLIVVASEPAENVGARRHTNGDILVEHAPISHELADLKPLRQTAYTQRSVPVVGMSSPVLTPDDCLSKTGKTFNVSYERSVYFGRGHSIPTSAPVTARWADKSRPMFRFRWGEESAHPETRTVRLRCAESLIPLPEGTRVRVTLRAKEILQKFDFTATLRTHFADGAMLVRPLKGRYVEKTLDSFVPVFGKPTMALANVPDASTSGSTAKTKKMAATRRLRKADSTGSPTSMSKSYRYPLKEEKTEQKTYPKYKNVLKVEDDDDDTQMFGRAEVNSVVAWNSSWSLVLLVLAHNSRIKEMIL